MTLGGDGSSPIEIEITKAINELRFCVQWSEWDAEFERWFDAAGEVVAFLVEHGRTYKRGDPGYSGPRIIFGRKLTAEQVLDLTKRS